MNTLHMNAGVSDCNAYIVSVSLWISNVMVKVTGQFGLYISFKYEIMLFKINIKLKKNNQKTTTPEK